MSDEQGLLAAILASPADDTARLVYADWLDDHAGSVPCPRCKSRRTLPRDVRGTVATTTRKRTRDHTRRVRCPSCSGSGSVPDGRAELIRTQIALAHLPGYTPHTIGQRPAGEIYDHARLAARERELLAAWGREWSKPVAAALKVDDFVLGVDGWFSDTGHGWRFARGFPAVVRLPLASFLGDRECPRCGGERFAWEHYQVAHNGPRRREVHCPACAGVGRVRTCGCDRDAGGVGESTMCPRCYDSRVLPPLAPALATVPGLTGVELSDREPAHHPEFLTPGWTWFTHSTNDVDSPDDLPRRLWLLLEGFIMPSANVPRFKAYPTRTLALAALNAAATKFAVQNPATSGKVEE